MRSLFARWASPPSPGVSHQVGKLVLGLGNPGADYARHRHNVGFQCLDVLAKELGVRFDEGHRVARLAETRVSDVNVALAKPKTFVNRSGEAVAALQVAATQASSCRKAGDPSGMARVVVTFAPSGRVTSATISGPPFSGTATGGCIASQFRSARVPAFDGALVTVTRSVVIQ